MEPGPPPSLNSQLISCNISFNISIHGYIVLRHACGVEVGLFRDYFIVTGGMNHTDWWYEHSDYFNGVNTVGLYSRDGLVRWLAPMNQARRSHGCTKFVTETGDTVRII